MPYLSPGVPVLSIKAIEVLKSYLDNNAEILDIACNTGDYKLINVTNVISCLDHEKSVFKMYPDSNRIMRIKRYAFIIEKVEKEHIFKIIEQPRATVFVSDEFRNRVIEVGLKDLNLLKYGTLRHRREKDELLNLKNKR